MKAVGDSKTCSKCRLVLDLDQYHKNRAMPDGLHSCCKECVREYNRRWRAENPEKKRAQKQSPHERKYHLGRYGLTVERFDAMLAAQGGACAICKSPDPGGSGAWHIDHDHSCCPRRNTSCGECVRGLLCRGCNLGLGLFRDNKDFLVAAALYLDE